MFLDDKLLEMCREADCRTADKINQLYQALLDECECYYKFLLRPNMTNKEVKVVLDRTFALWDSFTGRATKEEGKMKTLGKLFQNYTFKNAFLGNEKLANLYNKL